MIPIDPEDRPLATAVILGGWALVALAAWGLAHLVRWAWEAVGLIIPRVGGA